MTIMVSPTFRRIHFLQREIVKGSVADLGQLRILLLFLSEEGVHAETSEIPLLSSFSSAREQHAITHKLEDTEESGHALQPLKSLKQKETISLRLHLLLQHFIMLEQTSVRASCPSERKQLWDQCNSQKFSQDGRN